MIEDKPSGATLPEKDRVAIMSRKQAEAKDAFYQYECWGALLMATGTGKTWVAIDVVTDLFMSYEDLYSTPNVVLAVPTEKLRDENWRDEFVKAQKGHLWEYMRRYCYASLDNLENEDIDLLIMDEGHNITEANSVIFTKNRVKRVLLLTATKPTDESKIHLLNRLKIKPVFRLPLDEAVALGIVAPYEITVVSLPLDNVDKYIEKGKKYPGVKITEQQKYNNISFIYEKNPSKFLAIRRAQLIYGSIAKTSAAKWILNHLIPIKARTLIFAGNIKQAEDLCYYSYHSKKNDTDFTAFKNEEIYRMSCVNAVNEGHNISNLDVGFVVQLNSNELNLIQRIGRIVRYRQDHIGKIIILEAENTKDADWVKKATANLNVQNIRRIRFADLVSGAETILFD